MASTLPYSQISHFICIARCPECKFPLCSAKCTDRDHTNIECQFLKTHKLYQYLNWQAHISELQRDYEAITILRWVAKFSNREHKNRPQKVQSDPRKLRCWQKFRRPSQLEMSSLTLKFPFHVWQKILDNFLILLMSISTRCLLLKSSSEQSWKQLNEMEAHNEIRKYEVPFNLRTIIDVNLMS